jgi:hypothetical protein
VSREGAAAEWRRCRRWLVPALEDVTEAEILEELRAGRVQLWRGERSAMLTQLVAAPEPYILVWLGGGELDELMALRPGVEAWARAQGARAARINGRRGWARALRGAGFARCDGELRKVL